MGHWTGTKYTFKLNEEDPSYQEILTTMQSEIDQKYIKEEEDPGESFGASMKVNKGKVVYSSSGYKSRVSNDLSHGLIAKIEKNINTKPDACYYLIQDNGENAGEVQKLYGYAKKISQHLLDAGYATNYGGGYISYHNNNGMEKFHECLISKEILAEVIKEGESNRLRREVLWQGNEINPNALYKKKSSESPKAEIEEKLLAYWLVYGTEDKYKVKVNYYDYDYLNVKEFLYALNFVNYEAKTGTRVLKDLTGYGVEFKEGLDSITSKFKVGVRYDSSGGDATPELVEDWYQENKQEFKEVPKFTKETVYYLKENYPVTFEKLKNKLIQLHKQYNDNLKIDNVEVVLDNKPAVFKRRFS